MSGRAIISARAEVALDGRADVGEHGLAAAEHSTVEGALVAVERCSMTSSTVRLDVAASSPTDAGQDERAVSPSSLRSGGASPSDQYDTTCSTPSIAASRSARSMPAAAATGVVDTRPSAVRTSTTFGIATAELILQQLLAHELLSEPGSSKPPDFSTPNAPPPITPATTMNNTVSDSTSRRRRP